MNAIFLPDPSGWHGALPLPHLGVIQATGPDSATFLHSQLSQDIVLQPADQARLAAYCSAKGRMLASAVTLRPQDEVIWLVTDAGVLPGALKRLSMFVLRAKTVLKDAGDQARVWGLAGRELAAQLGLDLATPAWHVQPWQGGSLVRLPDVLNTPRWWWIGPADGAAWLQGQAPLSETAWRWLDVQSGVPHIEAATVDQFVPQMVNYELIGGVNFQKGCYPGQEIVARSQYRGTVKRRAVLVHADASLQAGQEVFSEADPQQPAGLVIQSAAIPDGQGGQAAQGAGGIGHSALIELKLQAWGTPLRVGSAEGPQLQPGTLPYPLPQLEAETAPE